MAATAIAGATAIVGATTIAGAAAVAGIAGVTVVREERGLRLRYVLAPSLEQAVPVGGPERPFASRRRHRHQLGEPEGELDPARLSGEPEECLDDRGRAVARDGQQVEIDVGALQPFAELVVGEAESGAGRYQQALGERRGGPAGPGREDLLEGRTVQRALH
ncbi:hypothetical protein [Streptomyces endophytica]|uniref:hypothetical protein n=1 Tax=Streptomyces endophytica TaxID=2991496 RepID=UPI00311B34E4